MKAEAPRLIDRIFGGVIAVSGLCLSVAGGALFVYQGYLYIELGVWGSVPTSSLFVEPRIPVDELQLKKDIEKARPQKQLPESAREWIVYKKLHSVIPGWFRAKSSWLSNPDHLYGLHKIVTWFLKIPLSALLILGGGAIMIFGLTVSEGDTT